MRLKQSTEQQVLLNLLKGDLPTHLDGVDIDALFLLFQRHRLFPIASGIVELLDDKGKEKWKSTIQNLSLRTLRQTAVLDKIVNGFKEEGIEVIPLKGPVLSQHLYGNLNSRHSVDLDILILEEDIGRIVEISSKLGYTLRFPKQGYSNRKWNYYFKYKKDIGLANPEDRIFVELHTGIDNHELLNPEEELQLWTDLTKQKIGGTAFYCMNNESSFLYLAYHGGLHQYTRLFWLRDVAEALTRWALDHNKILVHARELGIIRLLGVSMELASEFFGSDIPPEYKPYLSKENKCIQRLFLVCKNRILGTETLSITGRINRQIYILSLKPGIYYKWAVIKSVIHRWYIGKFLGGH